MAEVYTMLYTEMKNCEPIFSLFQDDEMCYEAVSLFVKFIESDDCAREIDTKRINFFLQYKSQDGRTDDTGYVKKIEKLSRWNWIDKFFYTIWFPWGIGQRYLIYTDDGRRYIFKFKNISQKTLDYVQAVLHEDKVKLDFRKEMR